MNREKAIKQLTRNLLSQFENTIGFGDVVRMSIQWADEHPKNPWRDAKKELPEKINKFFSDFVLVMYTRGGKPYPSITRYDYDCGIWEIDNVTHWMPFPQPPKGGKA